MDTSLLTKYRPRTFKEVIGQDEVVRSLEKALAQKLGKTFLFTGAPGLGKTTLARLAAAKLGCAPSELTEVDAASKTGIDDMRDLTSDLFYQPLDGPIKALIIDETHALSKFAFQSLLKILEEPPSWVYWFLCTTDAGRVPEAIKTRALTYTLKPVAPKLLFQLISVDEAADVPDDVLELCAKEAGGSPRQALANLAVCLSAKSKDEASQLLRSATDSKEAIDLARALFQGASWADVRGLLGKMTESDPESVRHVVRAYATRVILGAKSEEDALVGLAILEAFGQPFGSRDGISPLVLACGGLLLSGAERPPF